MGLIEAMKRYSLISDGDGSNSGYDVSRTWEAALMMSLGESVETYSRRPHAERTLLITAMRLPDIYSQLDWHKKHPKAGR